MLSADYITPDWRRQALVLGCVPYSEQHSSSNIADWLTKQLNDWNLTAVTELIASDTASNQMGIFNLELAPHLPRHLKPNDKIKKALLLVVRRLLTAPPSSTNVERLFSYGGLVATDHRASLAPEKLDQVLFLRENALMANFDLGWL